MDIELTLEHHHGSERAPMEISEEGPSRQIGKRAWEAARTYVCTQCKQKVTVDFVGAAQTLPAPVAE
jgi:hypothetical protein